MFLGLVAVASCQLISVSIADAQCAELSESLRRLLRTERVLYDPFRFSERNELSRPALRFRLEGRVAAGSYIATTTSREINRVKRLTGCRGAVVHFSENRRTIRNERRRDIERRFISRFADRSVTFAEVAIASTGLLPVDWPIAAALTIAGMVAGGAGSVVEAARIRTARLGTLFSVGGRFQYDEVIVPVPSTAGRPGHLLLRVLTYCVPVGEETRVVPLFVSSIPLRIR